MMNADDFNFLLKLIALCFMFSIAYLVGYNSGTAEGVRITLAYDPSCQPEPIPGPTPKCTDNGCEL